MDNASSEPVWENLRRREELRKAETATGGRKKYVSPLELFRMQLDADAAGEASTSTAVGEEEEIGSGQEDDHDSAVRDIDPDTPSVVPPPSPDDCEADSRLQRMSLRSFSEADVGARMPEGQASNDQSMVFSKESWLKCMFPFKQCRKAMKSASRTLGLVDMSTTSKDTFFRNPLYNKNKLKARNNKSQGQVDESAVSTSNKSKTKMSKNRSVERSDGSKKISAAVSCPGSERRKGGTESGRYHADDEADLERSDGESMGEPDFAVLVEYYRRPGTFPFGRPSQSSSPVVKQKSCRSVGTLRRALLRSRHPPETRRATVSASPDPSKLRERRRPETPDFGGHGNDRRDVVVFSHARGKGGRAKVTRSPMIPEGIVRRSLRGKGDANSVAADQDKSKSSAGGRNARGTEDSSDTGFTAFVRFQGFDVYANQRGSAPAEPPNLESQYSSASGSRNTSRNNSRNSTHSKNSDRYYQRK